ncbi:DUF932 domain-containing protein [Nitratiruptor tergarcus]|uniref:DUF932 domain-containing protein n=1 Tax=Nitratiruptor tergarcus TaxID=269259 RepID=UPI001E34AC12|nr:DUF932 domain-containing protein [Nitratiruptor tergarcus]
MYRFACANGLVIANSVFKSYKIRHIGYKESNVLAALENIASFKPTLQKKISLFESIRLSADEKLAFANAAIPLRFNEHIEVNTDDIVRPRREEDQKDDLYTVFNVIQENLLRGNLKVTNKNSGKSYRSRQIRSILKDIQINQALWNIAEQIAKSQSNHLAIAA